MDIDKWDRRFMLLAHQVATWSKETGRHVGAVIVGTDNEIVSTGYNGFPRGVRDDVPERNSKENGAKYIWSSHAERSAIYNAARIGVSLRGTKIYVPWFPCANCAIAIIQSGIAEVVAYDPDLYDGRWASEFAISKTMFEEAGVKVRYIPKLQELEDGSQIANGSGQ
ncbi:MAG: cytidine/deoxycytidylate deaminase family protein [Bdellovibrionales bacterium]